MSIYVFKEEKNSGADYNGVGPFVAVDFLIAWAVAYSIFHGGTDISINRSWNFTWFQSLILGLPFALLFVIIMFLPVIGLIIRSLFSLLDTGVVCTFIPFSRWVNGSLWWLIPIYCIFFFIFLLLHGITVSDIMLIQKLWNLCLYILKTPIRIYYLIRKSISQRKKSRAVKKSTEPTAKDASVAPDIYRHLADAVGKTYPRTQEYENFFVASKNTNFYIHVRRTAVVDESGKILAACSLTFSDISADAQAPYEITVQGKHGFAKLSHKMREIERSCGLKEFKRFQYESDAHSFCATAQQVEEEQRQRMENERRQREEYERRQREQQSRNTSSSSGAQNQDSLDEALFNGCNDKESLKQRYRQLMKTFHPDNQNGNAEMAQRIQSTYDRLAAKY